MEAAPPSDGRHLSASRVVRHFFTCRFFFGADFAKSNHRN